MLAPSNIDKQLESTEQNKAQKANPRCAKRVARRGQGGVDLSSSAAEKRTRTTRLRWQEPIESSVVLIPGKDVEEERDARALGGSYHAVNTMIKENTAAKGTARRLGPYAYAAFHHNDVKSYFDDEGLTLTKTVYPVKTTNAAPEETSPKVDEELSDSKYAWGWGLAKKLLQNGARRLEKLIRDVTAVVAGALSEEEEMSPTRLYL